MYVCMCTWFSKPEHVNVYGFYMHVHVRNVYCSFLSFLYLPLLLFLLLLVCNTHVQCTFVHENFHGGARNPWTQLLICIQLSHCPTWDTQAQQYSLALQFQLHIHVCHVHYLSFEAAVFVHESGTLGCEESWLSTIPTLNGGYPGVGVLGLGFFLCDID